MRAFVILTFIRTKAQCIVLGMIAEHLSSLLNLCSGCVLIFMIALCSSLLFFFFIALSPSAALYLFLFVSRTLRFVTSNTHTRKEKKKTIGVKTCSVNNVRLNRFERAHLSIYIPNWPVQWACKKRDRTQVIFVSSWGRLAWASSAFA